MNDLSKEDLKKHLKLLVDTVYKNPYIPHKPFDNQIDFLTYPSEELFYGGAAGGGKSDSLLMAALQYVGNEYKIELEDGRFTNPYSALILRRTYQDLSQPGAIMDRAHKWLRPFVKHGLVKWNNQTKTFTFPSDATLSFGYLAHDNDLDQYQGAEFQYIGFDELTQFTEKQYSYMHSRLRKPEKVNIPIRMRGAGNPGGRGHEWVKKKFVRDDAPQPFIQSFYTDNIYLDKQYGSQLDKISDNLTLQQLKYGDWDAILTKGLLVNRNQLTSQLIPYTTFKDWYPIYCVIGVDPASTGTDKFAISCLVKFMNNYYVLVDLRSTASKQPEQMVLNFITDNLKYKPLFINFELEPGSLSHYGIEYWENELYDILFDNGIRLTSTSASSTGNKFTRATPHATLVRQGLLYFNESLLLDTTDDTNPLRKLFNQYVYVHPDKEVMKNYDSPDELDSVSYAFMKFPKDKRNNVYQTGTQKYKHHRRSR